MGTSGAARGVALLALVGGLAALYGEVVVGLWSDWLHDENYSHGILIVPAVGWLVWRRRRALAGLELRPSWGGAVLVAASLSVFLVGNAAVEFFLTRISLVGVLAGLVVQLYGWRHLRALLFPLLLVALAIPLPSLVFNEVALPLQILASRLGVGALDLAGIPVVREGNIILLESATLQVAEACSGVRSLISLATVALFYGHLGDQRPWVRGLVIVSVIPIVIVANGLRVAGAGVAAEYYGVDAAAGLLHQFSGWIFFGGSVLMLFALERTMTVLAEPVADSRAVVES